MKRRPYGLRTKRPRYRALHPPWRDRVEGESLFNSMQRLIEEQIDWKVRLAWGYDIYFAFRVAEQKAAENMFLLCDKHMIDLWGSPEMLRSGFGFVIRGHLNAGAARKWWLKRLRT